MKTEKEKARIDFLYRTKYLPAYLAFIACYPFGLENLEGEIWEWIAGYEGLYQISNFGRIKSFTIKKSGQGIMILQPHLTRNGYLNIKLNKNGEGKDFSIHRLVAQAFIPNPENKPFVNHKDGNRFNNYFENLEWTTPSENNQHALKMGLSKSGANRSDAKLTKENVKFIREHYKPRDPKYSGAALARKFNIDPVAIHNVIHRKTYKNID